MEKIEDGDSSSSHHSLADYAPLLRAILEDDWAAANIFIDNHPINCLEAPITKEKGTALHTAAAAKRTRFVQKLVKKMTPKQLELTNNGNCTALYFAAQSEIVTIAELMVKKNKNLPLIFPEGDIEFLPLSAAIMTGNRDMVSYLYSVTHDIHEHLTSEHLATLLAATIYTDLYDVAVKILETLISKISDDIEKEAFHVFPLLMLASKPAWTIGKKSQPSVWERWLNSCSGGRLCHNAMMQASAHQLVDRLCKQFKDDHMFRNDQQLVSAAEAGNVEYLIIVIRCRPHLIWMDDEIHASLFQAAIEHRQERVFNLIYEIGLLRGNLASYYEKEGSTMLHLVGNKLPSTDRLTIVPGAALQMQRELLWFQEIENILPKSYVKAEINRPEEAGETPWDKFVESHENLRKDGEKWMKDTAKSCMLVAALIATVVFPAAFTVPGGNNQETGIPIFLKSNWFMVFFISDAVAMLFSSSSILVFLSILTSRYTAKDFLVSLPRRLALGLATLLISIVGMLIAFTAACLLVFKQKTSIPIRIIVAAPAVPISLFVILHYRLWFDIFRSAFCSKRLLSKSQNMLFPSKQPS